MAGVFFVTTKVVLFENALLRNCNDQLVLKQKILFVFIWKKQVYWYIDLLQ